MRTGTNIKGAIQELREFSGPPPPSVLERMIIRTLEQAIAQISRLPDADQELIGRKLLSHVEKLIALRADVDKGIRSLDAGAGTILGHRGFSSPEEFGIWRSLSFPLWVALTSAGSCAPAEPPSC